MINLKEETVEHIGNKTVEHISITRVLGCTAQPELAGESNFILPLLDFDYDNAHGSQKVNGFILYTDGSWSERMEYNGSEWWRHVVKPTIPRNKVTHTFEGDRYTVEHTDKMHKSVSAIVDNSHPIGSGKRVVMHTSHEYAATEVIRLNAIHAQHNQQPNQYNMNTEKTGDIIRIHDTGAIAIISDVNCLVAITIHKGQGKLNRGQKLLSWPPEETYEIISADDYELSISVAMNITTNQ